MTAEPENRTFSDKFMLRLPDGLRDRIKAEADKNGRSMNSEIVALLERHYPTLPTLEEMLESSQHMAFRLGDMIEKRGGEIDVDTRKAIRSFLLSLNMMREKITPSDETE